MAAVLLADFAKCRSKGEEVMYQCLESTNCFKSICGFLSAIFISPMRESERSSSSVEVQLNSPQTSCPLRISTKSIHLQGIYLNWKREEKHNCLI